ncbi:MAG: hypothetical protein PHC61_18175 [Chitinivibrionales bacterium]|nr:hypothetical protein [Chitinivibrionales bacterium]
MIKQELISRSPLRILEQSIQGGLGVGNIGIIAGRKGLGKTACLVHIATDQLLRQRHVIHLSFAPDAAHIVSWYEDIFDELRRRYHLDCAREIHDDIIKNRIIMNFKQESVSVAHLHESIRSVVTAGKFAVNTLVIDGFDFARSSIPAIRALRALAAELGLEIWASASVPADEEGSGIPAGIAAIAGECAIVIRLLVMGPYIKLVLVKDHDRGEIADPHLMLDPKILLIAREDAAEAD